MNSWKRGAAAMLVFVMLAGLLSACGDNTVPGKGTATLDGSKEESVPETTVETAETTPPPTAPADGNPDDVTCKGSYSDETPDPDTVVAIITLPTEPPVETEPTAEETDESTEAAAEETEETAEETTEPATEPTEPPVTEILLTNEELQVWYWMEVAAYRASGLEGPDFDQGLDTQLCEADETAVTWQQYFLQRALNTWHTSQALVQMAQDAGLPTEEAYQPNLKHHATYLTDIPATKYLYGYNHSYSPNQMHQAYLDSIPELLQELAQQHGFASAADLAEAAACAGEETLAEYARVYNLAYMYFTNLHYYIEPTAEEIEAQVSEMDAVPGRTVDIRHILLIPEGASVADDGTVTASEEAWTACEKSARTMMETFLRKRDHSEARFAELAHDNSMDAGSALDGGAYRSIAPGQLALPLDQWCFDEARQAGDTELVRTGCGWHIVYFVSATEKTWAAAETALIAQADRAILDTARKTYPMTVDYSAIVLENADSALISSDTLLYPDVAHERYPTVPLYLQQDYPTTRYGAFPITTHGCGITTMSMLASYMSDTELTPPEMCARFGRYCYVTGTDSRLFEAEPAGMDFYLLKKTFNTDEAWEALKEGHTVVCVQHKGYWTRGGHFLVLKEVKENDMIIVRDSNIYNYGKLTGHKVDEFSWNTIVPSGMGYWIYDYKITRIPACSRCGEETQGIACAMFSQQYTCHKCGAALERRAAFQALCS